MVDLWSTCEEEDDDDDDTAEVDTCEPSGVVGNEAGL